MATSFPDLQQEAEARWHALNAGDRPWVRIGSAMCGQAAGADAVFEALTEALGRNNAAASVSRVGCLGLCFAEPLVDVQFPGGPRIFYSNVTPETARQIADRHLSSGSPVRDLALGYLGDIEGLTTGSGPSSMQDLDLHPMRAMETRIALRNAGNIDPLDIYQYVATGGYRALYQALTQRTPEETLAQVADSGLRGRGGAAFSTGTKWRFLAGSNAPVKYILCNCEEGDPGAYNDKGILESDPHTLIEGMILAGYATGATYGYVFIRHGHDGPIDKTRAAVQQAQKMGLLGRGILGSDFDFDIEVALTGDSYVAGEESGLMESIEGHRAMPRYRPPVPGAGRVCSVNPPISTTSKPWPTYPR